MGWTGQPETPAPSDGHDGVIIVGDVIAGDLRSLCNALRELSIDASTDTVAEMHAALSRRVAPHCLVVDLRAARRAHAFLEAYCRNVSRHVLIVTDLADSASRLHALEIGVADDLIAPFDLAEAVARVRLVIAHSKESGATRMSLGDLSIDFRAGDVSRNGERVELTSRELAVLVALIREAPRVVSKKELLEQVWEGARRTQNLVEATVSSLRRKLEYQGPRVVHTAHGFGYTFRAAPLPPNRAGLSAERRRLMQEREGIITRRDEVIGQLRGQLAETRKQMRSDSSRSAGKNKPGE